MKLNEFWKGMTRNAPETAGSQGAAPEGEPPVVAEEAAPDYSWMPEDYRKDGTPDFDSFKGHYQELLADQARRAEESTVPEAYDFALPEGFDLGVELPEGVDIALDTENPLFGEFGTFLKERGISQERAELAKEAKRPRQPRNGWMNGAACSSVWASLLRRFGRR